MSYPTDYVKASSPPSGGPKPGARNLMRAVLDAHKGATNLGIYNPRDVAGNVWPNFKSSPSQHATGRACDFGIPVNRRPSLGDSIAQDLVDGASGLGVSEVIWSRRRWTSAAGWRPYTGRSAHLDHVHVTLHPAAADGLTLTEAQRALNVRPVAAARATLKPPPEETDDMATPEVRKQLDQIESDLAAATNTVLIVAQEVRARGFRLVVGSGGVGAGVWLTDGMVRRWVQDGKHLAGLANLYDLPAQPDVWNDHDIDSVPILPGSAVPPA